MKTLLILLLASSTALAVTTVQFARRASSEKVRADHELVLRQKQEARLRELELTVANQDQRLAEQARVAATVMRAAESSSDPSPTKGSPAQTLTTRPAATVSFGALAPGVNGVQAGPMGAFRPWQSATGQKFMRAQMRGHIRRMYGDAPAELGLNDQQSKALFDLLADQQSRQIDARVERPRDPAGARASLNDVKDNASAEIAAVIGQDKMPQWTAYQSSMAERSQVMIMGMQFENSGMPLRDEQRRQLVDLMVDESARHPRPSPEQMESLTSDEWNTQLRTWQDEHDQAVLNQAKSILTSEQYEQYRAYNEFQAEMRRNAPSFAPGVSGAVRIAPMNSLRAQP